MRCIVLTGGDTVFAAGADLRDMADRGAVEIMLRNTHTLRQTIAACPKPVIAAVSGLAWGGGCELAMHADIIVAGRSASFCQPEVKVGIMPGFRDAARAALGHAGLPLTTIHDSPGFVAQQRIATPDDIDGAVTLGLGDPKGPLAFGDALGARTVLEILGALPVFATGCPARTARPANPRRPQRLRCPDRTDCAKRA